MPNAVILLVLPAVFSLSVTTLHLFIFAAYGAGITVDQVIGILIGSVNEFTIGLLVSTSLFLTARNWYLYYSVLLFFVFVVFLKIICFHYEAVFGNLPGASILYYLSELQNLSASIRVNLPLTSILFESAAIFGPCLFFYYYLLPSRHTEPVHYGWAALASLPVILAVVIQLIPSVVPDKYFQQSREAITWLVKSNFVHKTYNVKNVSITPEIVDRFLSIHGHENTAPVISSDYPFCRLKPDISGEIQSSKSVIFLILESVGYDVMYGQYAGKQLMPGLQKIAAENLSFKRIYATGIKSAQALPAIFSGLPAQPFNNYLWTSPLLNFQGFPGKLRQDNYRTVYLHGSDLTFEHQRQYLSEIGFEELIEYKPDKKQGLYGWGYDDRTMFGKLKEWIRLNGSKADVPYLATLFTLSTHDPYVLPTDWTPVFSEQLRVLKDIAKCCEIEGEKNSKTALAETYRFLDAQVLDFYRWYKQHASDALLVIIGDHPSHINITGKQEKSFRHRFHVPFIIAGMESGMEKEYAEYSYRTGSQHDVPSTLMNILGRPSIECDLGINLLLPEQDWPYERYIYAVGGDSFEHLQIWHQGMDITLDRTTNQFHVNENPGNRRIDENKLSQVLDTIFLVHYYLLENNAYAFNYSRKSGDRKLPSVKTPIIISHRGNVNGTSDSSYENSRRAIENVLNTDFDWIEVDVQITGDGVPVLLHDQIVDAGSEKILISELDYEELMEIPDMKQVVKLEDFVRNYSDRLNMLIEIKDVQNVPGYLHITREVASIIKERPYPNRVIVDSFNEYLSRSIRSYCECEAGYDMAYKKRPDNADLNHAARMNFDWIYLHYDAIDESLIKAAHEYGLKVMAYTVNDMEIVEQWAKTELPDGIITDSIAINNYFNNNR